MKKVRQDRQDEMKQAISNIYDTKFMQEHMRDKKLLKLIKENMHLSPTEKLKLLLASDTEIDRRYKSK